MDTPPPEEIGVPAEPDIPAENTRHLIGSDLLHIMDDDHWGTAHAGSAPSSGAKPLPAPHIDTDSIPIVTKEDLASTEARGPPPVMVARKGLKALKTEPSDADVDAAKELYTEFEKLSMELQLTLGDSISMYSDDILVISTSERWCVVFDTKRKKMGVVSLTEPPKRQYIRWLEAPPGHFNAITSATMPLVCIQTIGSDESDTVPVDAVCTIDGEGRYDEWNAATCCHIDAHIFGCTESSGALKGVVPNAMIVTRDGTVIVAHEPYVDPGRPKRGTHTVVHVRNGKTRETRRVFSSITGVCAFGIDPVQPDGLVHALSNVGPLIFNYGCSHEIWALVPSIPLYRALANKPEPDDGVPIHYSDQFTCTAYISALCNRNADGIEEKAQAVRDVSLRPLSDPPHFFTMGEGETLVCTKSKIIYCTQTRVMSIDVEGIVSAKFVCPGIILLFRSDLSCIRMAEDDKHEFVFSYPLSLVPDGATAYSTAIVPSSNMIARSATNPKEFHVAVMHPQLFTVCV